MFLFQVDRSDGKRDSRDGPFHLLSFKKIRPVLRKVVQLLVQRGHRGLVIVVRSTSDSGSSSTSDGPASSFIAAIRRLP